LYFCLTGKNPWADLPSTVAVIRAVVSEQIDLSGLPVSAEFRAVLGRAIARNPGDRFPDAAALQNALFGTPEMLSILPETKAGEGTTMPPSSAPAVGNDPIL
jgi:hypothetical protein